MFHTENFYEVDFSMSVIQSKVERDMSTNIHWRKYIRSAEFEIFDSHLSRNDQGPC